MIFFSNFILVAIGNQLCLKFIVAEMEERLKPRGEWGGGGGESHDKRAGMLFRNFEKNPQKVHDPVLWALLDMFFTPKRYQL